MKLKGNHEILIAAHRGDSIHRPENTMQAFEAAAALGVDMIETDIHRTADGALVLMHDHTVDRTTDGHGLIREMTLAQIRQLNAGTAECPARVPLLRELLELTAATPGLLLDLEIKTYLADEGPDRVEQTLRDTDALCREFGLEGRVLLNSFDAWVLERAAALFGKRYYLHGYYPYTHMQNVRADPATYLDYACYWASGEEARQACEFLTAHGMAPCTGSHTGQAAFREAAALGCAMFTENDPAEVMTFRDALR